jgi:hypothetical protein
LKGTGKRWVVKKVNTISKYSTIELIPSSPSPDADEMEGIDRDGLVFAFHLNEESIIISKRSSMNALALCSLGLRKFGCAKLLRSRR